MELPDRLKLKEKEVKEPDCCIPDISKNLETHSREICGACNKKGAVVPTKTIRFHLKAPWRHTLDSEPYNYCGSEKCDVAYYSEKGGHILKRDVKGMDYDLTICHCFNITSTDLENEAESEALKEYVIQQIKNKNCACEINNPSGRCCLANFPK